MRFDKIFFITLEGRVGSKLFLIALLFSIFYFLFQLFFPATAGGLNDSFYVDKIAHVTFGYVLFSFWYFFASGYNFSKNIALLSAFLFVLAVGLFKEYLDLLKITSTVGLFSVEDILSSFFGILIFYIADFKTKQKVNKEI